MADTFKVMAFGAHPDDCEIKASGIASKWVNDGHEVCFCSVTNGQSGHHTLKPEEAAAERLIEARVSAEKIGVKSLVLGEPDGYLMPSLEARAKVITAIREFKPDLILTHRPNDYHPDHRYTSQLVQDAAYTVQVPNIVPEAAPLDHNPVIAYFSDNFQKPHPFVADVIIQVDDAKEHILDVLMEHKSQFFGWLPHIAQYEIPVPDSDDERREWLWNYVEERFTNTTERFADLVKQRYGNKEVKYTEAFEGCEYGSPLDQEQIERFFGAY